VGCIQKPVLLWVVFIAGLVVPWVMCEEVLAKELKLYTADF
jgi:uncharacterized membrane protein YciS (DUF1049 family)